MVMDGAQLLIAFTAGALAFLSPCSLPMLPAYVSYMLERGDSKGRLLSGLTLSAAMIGGFLLVFVVIGVIPSLAVSGFMSSVWLAEPVIGGGLVILGLVSGWTNALDRLPSIDFALDVNKLSFVFYGIAYGVASLGCSLPVFILIVLQGAAVGNIAEILALFAAYGVGAAALIIPLTLSLSLAKRVIHERLLSVLPYMKRVNGIVLIAAGVYMLYSGLIS
jgi:cytochrome c biogenesis protein CcdA